MPISNEELRLKKLVEEHELWRNGRALNMLASENLTSPEVQRYLSSDMGRRYTLPIHQELHGEVADNGYAGTRYVDEVEALASGAAARLLGAKVASVRPLSGHIAAMAVISALIPRGGRYMVVFPEDGGYDGYSPGYLPQVLGHEAVRLPLHGPTHRVDVDEATSLIRQEKPQAVVLGQSFVLFPYPVKAIADAVHDGGGLLLYDASHVLGLVMGGGFQDPLGEGVDVVYGSTHKSFFGPQGGIIASRREDLFSAIDSTMTWRVLDNAHWNRIAALGQALLEMERNGPAYAKGVVQNSQALGKAMEAEGIPLFGREEGYSESHQLFLDGKRMKDTLGFAPPGFARRLEAQDILIDLVGRVGTAEATRVGLGAGDMTRVASLMREAGVEGKHVAEDVHAFRSKFRGLSFA
jgi:glycine hydroxymethyltransferase